MKRQFTILIIVILVNVAATYYILTSYYGKAADNLTRSMSSIAIKTDSLLAVKSDSITLLLDALSVHRTSLCDTLTTEELIKLGQLEKYDQKIYAEKEKKEMKACQDHENAELKAYKAKETKSYRRYYAYRMKEFECLMALPKATLDRYIVVSFWKQYDNDNRDYWSEYLKMEDSPEFKDYRLLEQERSKEDKRDGQEYSAWREANDNAYQGTLKAIEAEYDNLLAAKKKELGL